MFFSVKFRGYRSGIHAKACYRAEHDYKTFQRHCTSEPTCTAFTMNAISANVRENAFKRQIVACIVRCPRKRLGLNPGLDLSVRATPPLFYSSESVLTEWRMDSFS